MHKQTDSLDAGLLEDPFGQMALAFSGGGFRAGTFALGVLSYLHQTKLDHDTDTSGTLLERVRYMSSASGGTIATAMYALYSAEGKPFGQFYRVLFEQTEGTILVSEALRILNDKNVWKERPEKQRNLINAFALTYDKLLFQGATVQLLNNNQESGNSHLEEVCFNATELYNGLLFRQTAQMKQGHWKIPVLYGNFNLWAEHDVARHLLLSDLLAASSCFPGGFEPIVYPADFANAFVKSETLRSGLNIQLQELDWEELLLLYTKEAIQRVHDSLPKPLNLTDFKTALQELPYNESLSISLMDGGITDNQGVESMIQSNQRRIQNKQGAYDLMMVCDVASHYMEAYQTPKTDRTSFWSINRVRIISLIVTLAGIGALVFLWFKAPSTLLWNVLQCVIAVVVSAVAIFFFLSEKVKNIITGQVNGNSGMNLSNIFAPQILKLLFRHFGNLRFNILKNMLITRLTTLLVLSGDVFLKRIRYLLYHQFFDLQNLKATGRAKANHIYDLSFSNDLNRSGKYNSRYQPSLQMQKVAENAFGMGTTLWFTKENDREFRKASIVACGQFNTCYNLLDYIEKLKTSFDNRPPVYNNFTDEKKAFVDKLQARMEQDFNRFREDPFWLYNELGESFEITHFQKVHSNNIPDPKAFNGLR